jgi:iron complex outermembrane receptor protein
MTNVGHYRKNEAVFDRDREYSQDGVSPLGSPGSFRPVNPDGTFGEWQADANCPDGQRSTTQPGINGEVCTFNFADRSVRLPEIEQTSLMSDMAYELNSTTELSLRLGGSRKLANWAYAPAPGRFTVPADVADGLNLPGIPSGSDVNFGYRLTELGDRVSEIVTDAWNVQAGVKKAVGDSWDLEIYGGHNRVHRVDEGVSGYALTAVLQERIANGDFNPVGTPGARGSLQGARYVPSQITTSQLANVDIVASGEVFEMPSGPAALAIGAQYTQQSYRDRYDERSVNGEVFGSAGSSGGGSRQTQSAFTELSMPVTQKLELQVAGRYDNYSDFGSTANPKLGLRYQASKSVLLRASAGTGFQAPLMQDLYAADSLGFPNFIDRVACQNEQQAGGPTPSCNPAQYLVTSSGNDGLEEVKSQSYNVGMIVQPNRAFNFGVDAWLTQLDNVVGINYEELTRAEAAGADISSTGVTVNRNPDGSLESIDAPLQNLSRQEISGLDVTMGVRLGRFDLTIDHSHVFYFKSEGFPGAGFRDFLDQNGNPMWRNTVSLGIIPADKHRTVFIARTVAGQQKLVKQDGRIPDYTEVDMQYIWSPGKIGDITFGAANILGTTPPLDNSNPNNQLNASLYNQLGRQYYMAYSKGF